MVEIARARYRYEKAQPGDLAFEANDIIRILEKNESGWWVGQLDNGMKGEFPFNFVEIISEEERAAIVNTRRITTEDTYDRANKDNNYNRIQDVSITPKRDKFEVTLVVRGGHNIQGIKSMGDFRKLDHTLHSLISNFDSILPPAWADNIVLDREGTQRRAKILRKYMTRLLGNELIEFGMASWLDPQTKYKTRSEIRHEHNQKRQNVGNGIFQNDPEEAIRNAPALARVAFDWMPHDDVELELAKGTIVAVINKHTLSTGWWEGETADGKRGLFPYNYVEVLSDNEAAAVVSGKPYSTGNEQGNALRALSPKQEQQRYGKAREHQKRITQSNFYIKNTESFDELMNNGFSLEVDNKVLRSDDTRLHPKSGDVCEVSYCAFVWNCQTQQIVEVASSDLPNSKGKVGPLVFKISEGQVIRGLELAVPLLTKGQKARLILSPKLGYGEVGNPIEKVPPNAFLIYDITLDSFGPKKPTYAEKGNQKRREPGSPRGRNTPAPLRTPRNASPNGNIPPPPLGGKARNRNMVENGVPPSPKPNTLAEAVARRARKEQQTNYNVPIQERPRRRMKERQRYKVQDPPYPTKKFPLPVLQDIVNKNDFQRANVNPRAIEDYLEDKDFHNTFGMSRENFLLLPKWQQLDMLRRAKLLPRMQNVPQI